MPTAADVVERARDLPRSSLTGSDQVDTALFTELAQQQQQQEINSMVSLREHQQQRQQEINSMGSLREQVGNVATELAVLRHEINTLRLADSWPPYSQSVRFSDFQVPCKQQMLLCKWNHKQYIINISK